MVPMAGIVVAGVIAVAAVTAIVLLARRECRGAPRLRVLSVPNP
jgi:hypothetical protein